MLLLEDPKSGERLRDSSRWLMLAACSFLVVFDGPLSALFEPEGELSPIAMPDETVRPAHANAV